MLPRIPFILLVATLTTWQATAQPYTLLIKHGYLIDPKSNLHDTVDIAIKDNQIKKIAKKIPETRSQKTIDARGLIITPGLIDIHTHVFFAGAAKKTNPGKGATDASPTDASPTDASPADASADASDDANATDASTDPSTNADDNAYAGGPEGLHPDTFSFRSGVTTIVDAGSSGWRNFEIFKSRVIDHANTRVLAFLNIVGNGMHGGHYEQDTTDMIDQPTATTAKEFKDYIVGIKVAHYEGASWHPVDAAVNAGKKAHIPVMIDFGGHLPPLPIRDLFQTHLRKGDIYTHCFALLTDREPLVDPATNTLKPFIQQARQKGIVFDVGYGEISFDLSQALPAIKSGFLPSSISSDLHVGATHDLLDIMSQFLAMGVSLTNVIRMTTWNPAQEINRTQLGHITKGAPADIAILNLQTGKFEFRDHAGKKLSGTQKLECIYTIKDGRIVYHRSAPRRENQKNP